VRFVLQSEMAHQELLARLDEIMAERGLPTGWEATSSAGERKPSGSQETSMVTTGPNSRRRFPPWNQVTIGSQ